MSPERSNKLHHKTQEKIVVVGASAGGIDALKALVADLPITFPAPILVVLHIAANSPGVLPLILAQAGELPVVPATDGEDIQAGKIYVAVADRHLMLEGDRIRLTRGPKENHSRPSVNILFRSAALSFGSRVIGVVLSGMLDDGTAGLWAIKDRGGMALVQNPEEAQYPSMPTSAIQHVQVDAVLPVTEMAETLVKWTSEWSESAGGSPMTKHMEIENRIALEDNALAGGILTLGPLSPYTCPDCHGVMVEIQEGSIVRFRCHTGHAHSVQSLLEGVNISIENNLWSTIRVIEERILLLQQMAEFARAKNNEEEVRQCLRQERRATKQVVQLRKLVLAFGESGRDEVEAG